MRFISFTTKKYLSFLFILFTCIHFTSSSAFALDMGQPSGYAESGYYDQGGYYGEGSYYSENSYYGESSYGSGGGSENGYYGEGTYGGGPTPIRTPTPTPMTYCIGGYVYVDANQNGNYTGNNIHYPEGGDFPLAGQQVQILNNSNGSVITSGTTDANGAYYICNLQAGGYTAAYTPPSGSGLNHTSPAAVTFTVPPNPRIDFGVTDPNSNYVTPTPLPTYTIYARVFADENGDGIYNGNDWIMAGKRIELRNTSNQYLDAATTDGTPGSGYAVFAQKTANTYRLVYTPDNGWALTTVGSYDIAVPPDNSVVYFGQRVPPIPTITPNPPNVTCVGNTPRVTFSWSSPGSTWYEVYQLYNGATLFQSSSATTFTHDYSTGTVGTTLNYIVRAFYTQGSSVYTDSPTTQNMVIPNCYYSITGTVWKDMDRDGTMNGPDSFYANATLYLSGDRITTTSSNGNYSFGGLLQGNYILTLTDPPTTTYVPTAPNPSSYSYFPLDSSKTNQNFGIVPIYTVPPPSGPGNKGTVYIDQNRDGIYAAGEPGYTGATLTLSVPSGSLTYGGTFTPQTTTSTSNGTYQFPNPSTAYLYDGTYRVTLTNPNTTRFQSPAALSADFTLPPSTIGPSFGLIPKYQISGYVFDDYSKDGTRDGAEPGMSGKQIQITGPVNTTVTTDANGLYTTGTILYEGQYTVTFTSPTPTGYRPTNPDGCVGNCSFTVYVGRDTNNSHCLSANLPKGATCANAGFAAFTGYDIQNVNFGWTNCSPWFQLIGSSGRINGTILNDGSSQTGFTDPISSSASPTCGGPYASIPGPVSNTPGIIFSPSINTTTFGQGQASPNPYNWQVASSYGPTTSNTSYEVMNAKLRQSGITASTLPAACSDNTGGCALDTLNGIYKTENTMYVTTSTIQSGANIVILVNNDLHILGDITLPTCASLTFSVSGNIYIDDTVGVNDITTTTANITGFFSTDKSFIIESNGNTSCALTGVTPDKRLNIAGSVVVNAAGGGGSVQNNRDLGQGNRTCPAFTIATRPDMLLCAPEFIKKKSDIWQEVAP